MRSVQRISFPNAMDGGKKFRSSVLIVKNALRFMINSERKKSQCKVL